MGMPRLLQARSLPCTRDETSAGDRQSGRQGRSWDRAPARGGLTPRRLGRDARSDDGRRARHRTRPRRCPAWHRCCCRGCPNQWSGRRKPGTSCAIS